MLVAMREIEYFSVYTVDDHQAELFTKHLTGAESFLLTTEGKPKSMMIYSLKYNYPCRSFAYAYLLSVDVDMFRAACAAGRDKTTKDIMHEYVVGRVELEFGGDIDGIKIKAMPLHS